MSHEYPFIPLGDERLDALDDPLLDAEAGEVLEADARLLQVEAAQPLLHRAAADRELAAQPDAVAHVRVPQRGQPRWDGCHSVFELRLVF